MSKSFITPFMLNLLQQLLNDKKVSESSANKYLQLLITLNDKKPFTSLSFTKNTSDIDTKLEKYAQSTQTTFYSTLVSVLSFYKDKPTYKKTYNYYYDKMMNSKPKGDTAVKSEAQEKNWEDWSEIQKTKQEIVDKVNGFYDRKQLTLKDYDTLLKAVIVCLYTDEISPRRNMDYYMMDIVKEWNENMSKDVNYYDISKNRFIFNKYKTAKKYGEQIIDIPKESSLTKMLNKYIKHHPLLKGKIGKNQRVKFLVKADGTPLQSQNAITRVLNSVFKKRIGSSMLRHIFLTNKYGDLQKEMSKDAFDMGHSVEQQREYVKE